MEIQFGENKINVKVTGESTKHIDQGDEPVVVLEISRRDSKYDGPGYRMSINLRTVEKRHDEKYGDYSIVKTNSDWLIHGLKAKFMTDVSRRTAKTDNAAVAWVRERLGNILEQFRAENPGVEFLEEVK